MHTKRISPAERAALRPFLILWSTQAFSSLGSAMTSYALVVFAFGQTGSALDTALLSVFSYAPYVLVSLVSGALSDGWNKKHILLVCDTLAALTTAAVLLLARAGALRVEHLYALNALSGLMNAVQQPAADVAVSLLTPPGGLQRVSGLRALSSSAVSVLAPLAATALLPVAGLEAVLWFDLSTFFAAFFALLLAVRLPQAPRAGARAGVWRLAREGLAYLRGHKGVLHIILFLAAINFTASAYRAALPALVLPRAGERALGLLSAVSGAAMLAGGLAGALLPAPRSRVRVVCNTLLLSMGTENLFLALGRTPLAWCVGAALGWIVIPLMNANLEALLRAEIPLPMQGRVYSARNALQFFTIPLGLFAGGALVDGVFEPFMAAQSAGSLPSRLFGAGAGAGAACLFFLLWVAGIVTCLIFRRDRHIRELERPSA